jgi:hypothetical protein
VKLLAASNSTKVARTGSSSLNEKSENMLSHVHHDKEHFCYRQFPPLAISTNKPLMTSVVVGVLSNLLNNFN